MSSQKVAVAVLLILQGMLAVIVISEPADLGLNSIVVKWLMIINIGVGIALNQLESLFGKEQPKPQVVNVINTTEENKNDAV
jgi:hypothetical protein